MSSLHNQLNWLLSSRSQVLMHDGYHRIKEQALLLPNIKTEIATDEQVEKVIRTNIIEKGIPFEAGDTCYESIILNKIVEHIESSNDFISAAFLLGSYSDLTYSCGWSDIDLYIVVKDSCIDDANQFLELRKRCLKMEELFKKLCPLQHHGVISVSESMLKNYQQNYLPPEVLIDSRCIYSSDQEIIFRMKEKVEKKDKLGIFYSLKRYFESALRTGIFTHHPYKGQYLRVNFVENARGMYTLFYMLGSIMTTPAYFFTAIGKPINKRLSFHSIANYLDSDQLSIIDRFSSIRRQWGVTEGYAYTLDTIPQWVVKALGDDWLTESVNFLDCLIKKIDESEKF